MNVEYDSNLKINKKLISFNFMMFYLRRRAVATGRNGPLALS